MTGSSTAHSSTAYDVRAELEQLLERDLLGPWDGPEEELRAGTTPGERYLLGKLVPVQPDTGQAAEPDEQHALGDVAESPAEVISDGGVGLAEEGDDAPPAAAVVRGRAMAATSLGLAFSVPESVDRIVVKAQWGRYERGPSPTQLTDTGVSRTVWKRVPVSGEVEVVLDAEAKSDTELNGEHEQVRLHWRVRHRNSRRVVEAFLVNAQPVIHDMPDRHRIFQAGLVVTALDGVAAIFVGHNDAALPEAHRSADPELRLLELQHRHQREYATGRQCAVDADVRDGETRAWRLRTTSFPSADVPMVEAGVPDLPGLVLDMGRLGSPDLQPDDLVGALRPLVEGYRVWLDEQEQRLSSDHEAQRFADVAEPALERARAVADRLARAIDLLRADPQAREAFRFANQAMARQRVRSELVRRRAAEPNATLKSLLAVVDVAANRSWRPFQLAFVLLCLPGLTDPAHRDAKRGPFPEGEAQLLFFPTGGGKTEAYLGLTAYAIAIRRLQGIVGTGTEARDGTDGVAVLMRYTLRLLTAQQFQRATALICACELLRQERISAGDQRWGTTPIRIGLWVGASVTPNGFDDAVRQLEDAGASSDGQVGGLQQFAACPWCGTPLNLGRDGMADKARRRALLFCGDEDGRCPFSRAQTDEGIPALVVDEEIYRLTPSLVIATVDKLASLPWDSRTAHLFGHVTTVCDRHGYRGADELTWCKDGGHPRAGALAGTHPMPVQALRPPDLIIQDELHLISDALGSMVGLYETLVDHLATRVHDGVSVRPVLVASTATVRRAQAQVQQVFARGLTVFPPPVLDAADTYFSRRVPPTSDTPARRYRGILAPGERLTAVEIRVMTALLEYGQLLFDMHGEAADPYMTVVDYFTSTRELAGMRRLSEDDVTDRLGRQGALVRRRTPLSIAELTSRMASRRITQSLADLDLRFVVGQDDTAAIERLRLLRREDKEAAAKASRSPRQRPVDVLLATSMLQVGVDVQRLGLMVVTGQPKNMAEYIQASSRVGRSKNGPGLVLAIYQWNRPRDLAHYEHFSYEHRTFGRRVEGLTTTPFSSRALDRGLTGVVVGAVRHASPAGLPNLGAHVAGLGPSVGALLIELVRARAEIATGSAEEAQAAADGVQRRLDSWRLKRQKLPAGQLGYRPASGLASAGLLRSPDDPPWDEWSAPRSLRDVEPEAQFRLRPDDKSWELAPQWDFSAPAVTKGTKA